ncbi:MAG: CPBP family intramembrane metalloprotease [Thermoanaerobaculales bacterium]|nr:CPBP family intramembrane metalloprotease [Thermoanaerobaculales bacterium]
MIHSANPRRALIALLLIAPIPSFGVIMAMVVAPGPVGKTIFTVAKIWLLVFPAAWYLLVEKGRPSWSPPLRGGLAVGAASGVVVAGIIVVGAWLLGVQNMDLAPLRTEVQKMGLHTALPYLAGAAGWTFVNSLMEEYVYRWFVFRQCETLMKGWAAVIASAAVFTAHHVIAVGQYLDPLLAFLASAGVFAGGVVWSWLYMRYRSIWPGWLSHVLADIAVFGIGWWLLFG